MGSPPLRLLGLDPGLRHTGWGIIDVAGNRLSHVADGTIHTDGDLSLADRLRQIHDGLVVVIERYGPAEAAVEETFVNKNPASTLKLGQARGVALLVPACAGLAVAEYATNLVKKSVVGSGHADKAQVEMMVRRLLPGCMPGSADAADALAVAICHAHHAQTVRAWGGAAASSVVSPLGNAGGEGRRRAGDVESQLWQRLRNRRIGATFRRQEPMLGFTVDFVAPDQGLVIELAGDSPADRATADQRRAERLEQAGFRVLRFGNNEVMENMDGVLDTIAQALTAVPVRRLPGGAP